MNFIPGNKVKYRSDSSIYGIVYQVADITQSQNEPSLFVKWYEVSNGSCVNEYWALDQYRLSLLTLWEDSKIPLVESRLSDNSRLQQKLMIHKWAKGKLNAV